MSKALSKLCEFLSTGLAIACHLFYNLVYVTSINKLLA
ncbi:hypothetical protein D082_33560 [Synechocystis sp. PCC 6714]|nr:hypothetical protein D082_33560 [Synechocystis sp. PCC 6714]